MPDASNLSRRVFLKLSGGTVLLSITPAVAAQTQTRTAYAPKTPQWGQTPGKAPCRIEGPRKVTGQKIFARDFRARDMPGWPKTEKLAMLLRAVHVDRPVLNIDLTSLPLSLQPELVITQARLDRDQISTLFIDQAPPGKPQGMFVAENDLATYQGQPVALLIFSTYEIYRQAARLLQFQDGCIVYGEPVGQVPEITEPYSKPTYLTLYDKEFSQVQNGKTNPYDTDSSRPSDQKAHEYREKIAADMKNNGWRLFTTQRHTQMISMSFMEPECGIGWFDQNTSTLNILLGTQSPDGDVGSAMDLFDNPNCPIHISRVNLTTCYPGGGFGGRDESPFTAILILAAVYAGAPVRIAYDRYAQFQGGLTRIRSDVTQTIAVDASGKFQAIQVVASMPAGGKRNYSQFVAGLAALSSGGGYQFPKAAIDAFAMPTTAPIGGSMRGFGGTQAAFAMETSIDEIARELKRDPLELRLQNVQPAGGLTVSGGSTEDHPRFDEICRKAIEDPLWHDREAERLRQLKAGRLYGVGFALTNQAYGTSGDGVMANIVVDQNGQLMVRTNAVDMGNGSATTLAIVPAEWLGRNAMAVNTGEMDVFTYLELSPNPISGSREQGANWDNPNYTASFAMSSSACLTGFHQVHVVQQAARILFRAGVLPAAQILWGQTLGPKAVSQLRWEDGRLAGPELKPLEWEDLVAVMHGENGVVEVTVHGYFAVRWCEGLYAINDQPAWYPVDGLVMRTSGDTNYVRYPRNKVKPPPANGTLWGRSVYSPSGTLAAVSIHKETGQVKVEALHTYLDAGKIHQPDLVIGQSQGGMAMGIGYALLENAPAGIEGPGNGRWNFDRYHVPMAADVPLGKMKLINLEPIGKNPTGKGIAESVLCPIAPAIANAVTAATGQQITTIPISREMVREALS